MISKSITYGKFRFGLVENKDVLKDTFRMRHEVYVEEFGFEKKEDHSNGLETDQYENDSIHFACLNENDSVVGTIRLVLGSDKGFPIEHAVETTFVGEKPDKSKIGEISRLTVSKDLRRRKEDGMYGIESYLKKKEGGILPDDGSIPEEMKGRKNPIIVLGLYQVMYHESKRRGITHWYMITDKKLFYALKKYGFIFHQIGSPVEYHGERTPYLGIIDELEKDLVKNNPDMLKIMLTGLENDYHPPFFKS
ncbi:MAG: PEP-CTERM/exosortase system-associated acyltransferase [Proteobacteria bacterium]|nr:PEP-CTERM/exosortase system-associated acyltransferase [Pseudomonadota bacterium]MBU1584305.1 PEP-CTERM/exosortase system-associated acyltransferase [Pseudomonadota bacterium]MBU2454045.1 PEP-CTERM/exosortase system-associated acyltransferase [Pseudomonadota bacterium]MBU2628852.1 PEP-CTERM/exosortase system-associated acyltransferase [Pseudomonadota bacterium]